MPKCPKCGEEIGELILGSLEWRYYHFNAYPEYEPLDGDNDSQEEHYNCPKCDAELFTDFDKALAFLNTKEEVKSGKLRS